VTIGHFSSGTIGGTLRRLIARSRLRAGKDRLMGNKDKPHSEEKRHSKVSADDQREERRERRREQKQQERLIRRKATRTK
jgi:hypothetical protein